MWSDFLFTVLALVFVLVLAWLFLFALKRFIGGRHTQKIPLHVVQALPLGGRERLLIVRYGMQEYVLGVTAHSIQVIDKHGLNQGLASPATAPPAPAAAVSAMTDVINGSSR